MSIQEERQLRGWDKFIYNLYMILTFPVRKWWIILGVLATILLVLIIIPTMEGVKKDDIVDWYKAKWSHSEVNRAKNKTIAKISKKIDEVKNNVSEVLPDSADKQAQNIKKKESDLVAWHVAEFKKAKYVPQEKSIVKSNTKVQDKNTFALIKEQMKKTVKKAKEQPKKEVIEEPVPQKEPLAVNEPVYYEVRTDLNLAYLDEPEEIFGEATIVGPNELYVGEDFVYLYGIYTNPRIYDENDAKNFLTNMTANQNVECDVVAYSTQTQAKTALCFVNGVLINKQMVAEGFADNVALKLE